MITRLRVCFTSSVISKTFPLANEEHSFSNCFSAGNANLHSFLRQDVAQERPDGCRMLKKNRFYGRNQVAFKDQEKIIRERIFLSASGAVSLDEIIKVQR